VGIQAAPEVEAMPEGAAGGVTTNPLWMLLPWAVFAFAAGVKFWRLTSAWRQRGTSNKDPEQFRRSLERIWANNKQWR
jgi:hypothetical protein